MGRSRVTEPPWDSATSFTIERPRPDPGRWRGGHIETHLRVAEGNVVHHLVHDFVELQLFERHRGLLVARDLDEVAHESGEALDLAHQIAEKLLSLDGIDGLTALEELEIGAKTRQRRAQPMRCI